MPLSVHKQTGIGHLENQYTYRECTPPRPLSFSWYNQYKSPRSQCAQIKEAEWSLHSHCDQQQRQKPLARQTDSKRTSPHPSWAPFQLCVYICGSRNGGNYLWYLCALPTKTLSHIKESSSCMIGTCPAAYAPTETAFLLLYMYRRKFVINLSIIKKYRSIPLARYFFIL